MPNAHPMVEETVIANKLTCNGQSVHVTWHNRLGTILRLGAARAASSPAAVYRLV